MRRVSGPLVETDELIEAKVDAFAEGWNIGEEDAPDWISEDGVLLAAWREGKDKTLSGRIPAIALQTGKIMLSQDPDRHPDDCHGLQPVDDGDDRSRYACRKCGHRSGDNWSQCGGECPIAFSPHYSSKCEMAYRDKQAPSRGQPKHSTATTGEPRVL